MNADLHMADDLKNTGKGNLGNQGIIRQASIWVIEIRRPAW